jgi:tetratricopeptide (TPR) repeat protein
MDEECVASGQLTPQQKWCAGTLLDELLDLPQGQRFASLASRTIEDPAVRAEVASLLHAVVASGDFLGRPAKPRFDDGLLDATLGVRLGAWRLTRLIGRGGMGDVYEGVRVDGEFEQRVAIKLLQRGTPGEAKRFQAERQMLADLNHPGIARLYDGGVTDTGRLYMVMEYIEGRAITEYCGATPATLEQRLALFAQTCAAVTHAHAHRVIHRDLKPSNILVTAEGEVKLLDFGIAKMLDAQRARITQAAAAPLSPICAAPEQLTGAPTTPATDVYALGLLLYELLTDSHPWMGFNTPMLQAMRIVLERAAPLASHASEVHGAPVPRRLIRGELDAIIAKALRKDPAERYQSVSEMQADIACYQHGQPVSARASARWYPATHFLRHHRWSVVGIAAACAVVLMGWRLVAQWDAAGAGRAVALVGFENLSGKDTDPWLGAALTEMVGTDLADADTMRVVPEELVRDVMKGMRGARAGSFGPDSLERLGHLLRADYIVSGNYLIEPTGADPLLRIDVAVQSVRGARSIARFSRQASLAALSELERQVGVVLRSKLGVPAATTIAVAQLASAQPGSLDVARLMGVAYDAMQHYDAARARDALLQVIAESPGFAPAYANLSEAWSALGYREKAVATAEQAVARGTGLPPEMQTRIDAVLQSAKSHWSEALADWQKLVALRPNNPEYRLHAIEAALAGSNMPAAQAQLEGLRALKEEAQDPRLELAAARIAAARSDSKADAAHAAAALALANTIGIPGLEADAQLEIGGANTLLGNFDVAARSVRAAIAIQQTLGNPRGEANARHALAHVLDNQHQLDAARAEFQHAMIIDQNIGDVAGIAGIYRDLAEMLWDSGDRDGAQTAARRALDLGREIADLPLQSWTLRALATMASDESASDSVMRDYEAVLALNERTGDLGAHVWSLTSYADVARMRGEMPIARKNCAAAQSEAAQMTDPQFFIYSTFTCALVAMDGGAPDRAAEMLRQVKSRIGGGDGGLYGANADLVLAQLEMEGGHCPQAVERLNHTLGALRIAALTSGEADAEALLALCEQQAGNITQRDVHLNRAVQLRRSVTSRQEVYFVDIVAAELAPEAGGQQGPLARLMALSADAEQRHWLTWSLEAKLAAWQLAMAHHEDATASRLRAELQSSATAHGMGRIIAMMAGRKGSSGSWVVRTIPPLQDR